MSRTVAVVTPAFRAEATIVATVQSLLAQSWTDWELWLVADDGADYEAFLNERGIADERIRFVASGGTGRGASLARNVALDRITAPFVGILDADDRMKPDKLARVVGALAEYPVVTTALEVMTEDFQHLRYVGHGPDRELTPGSHKWVSLSMDSMVAWDRRRTDARYDPTLSNMTDLELLLQLWRQAPVSMHLGAPLHDYVKRSQSMSNGKDVAAGMIRSKTEILRRLREGHYGLPEAEVAGVARFLDVSLDAERAYGAALAANPGLLFEDHLEPRLRAARAGMNEHEREKTGG